MPRETEFERWERISATVEPLELVWGIANIARFIGRTNRQTYEALVKGELPARQVNRRWVCSQRRLREHFEGVVGDG